MPKGYYTESRRTQSTGTPSHVEHARAITLLPHQVLTGICFHLMEERLAALVDARSIERQAARLEEERLRVIIAREEWREMTNRQRLQCLLATSETAFVMIGDGRVALMAND
jgi:hypothetical protein